MVSMTQTVIACAILLISSFYVFRLLTRSLSSKKRSGCGGSCGCGDKGKQPSLTKERSPLPINSPAKVSTGLEEQ